MLSEPLTIFFFKIGIGTPSLVEPLTLPPLHNMPFWLFARLHSDILDADNEE